MSTANTVPIISTPQELEAAFVELRQRVNGDYDETTQEICGVSRWKRTEELTASEFATLNAFATRVVRFYKLKLDKALAIAILGARQVDPAKESYDLALGDKKSGIYYKCERNKHNRFFSLSRCGKKEKEGLLHDMLLMYWGLADTALVDCLEQIVSLQHRAKAYLAADFESGGDLAPIEIWLQIGTPPQFAGLVDRNRSRTSSDQEYTDVTRFPEDLIVDVFGEVLPDQFPKIRTDAADLLVTVSNWTICRMQGINVHPNKDNTPSERQRLRFIRLFDSDMGNHLERLILQVLHGSKNEKGKKSLWVDTFTPSMVATALVLYSNRTEEPIDPLTFEGEIPILNSIVDKTIELLKESSEKGSQAFSPAIEELATASKAIKASGGGAINQPEKFNALVSAMSQLLDGGAITEKVFDSKADRKKRKKGDIEAYRIFGGRDTGPIAKSE